MKKIHRVLAMLMAAIMALSLITTAFAEPTIDPSKKASLSIYKYDITTASAEGAWDAESYVSTGLHDDAVVDKLAKYAIQGVEFTCLRVADVIPLSLHQRLRAEQEQRRQTLSDYITDILKEHFDGGAKTMNTNTRTIAFQVPEELFDRLKDYLAKHGLKQKDFILGLIERELNDAVDAE